MAGRPSGRRYKRKKRMKLGKVKKKLMTRLILHTMNKRSDPQIMQYRFGPDPKEIATYHRMAADRTGNGNASDHRFNQCVCLSNSPFVRSLNMCGYRHLHNNSIQFVDAPDSLVSNNDVYLKCPISSVTSASVRTLNFEKQAYRMGTRSHQTYLKVNFRVKSPPYYDTNTSSTLTRRMDTPNCIVRLCIIKYRCPRTANEQTAAPAAKLLPTAMQLDTFIDGEERRKFTIVWDKQFSIQGNVHGQPAQEKYFTFVDKKPTILEWDDDYDDVVYSKFFPTRNGLWLIATSNIHGHADGNDYAFAQARPELDVFVKFCFRDVE